MIFDTLIQQSKTEEVEAVLGQYFYSLYFWVSSHRPFPSCNAFLVRLTWLPYLIAHELGHWYYLHPTKLLCISQLHVFTILALFPAFLHAPPVLSSFDFPPSVATKPPTIIAFLLFQVRISFLVILASTHLLSSVSNFFPVLWCLALSLSNLALIYFKISRSLIDRVQMILTPLEAFVGIGMNAVSRKFEWEADRFACELQEKLDSPEMGDMGQRLGRALIALHVKNLSTVWVDWL